MKTERNGGSNGRRTNGGGSRTVTRNGNNGHALMAADAMRQALRARVKADPAELLPLSEPVFHILLALADRNLHGYGIILSVEESTAGKVRLRTGTLYTAVRRMAEDGLIAEASKSGDDRRRIYTLTSFGRSVARAESRRIASLATLARARGLLARGARPHFR
jgi:DNA-binding PadR family transcriptional regulator